MRVVTREKQQKEVCPFCKDHIEQSEARPCESCHTVMHRECFQENGGCAVLGCSVKSQAWPCCSHCQEQLPQLSSILCVRCGYHQEEQRFIHEGSSTQERARSEHTRIVLDNPDAVDWSLPSPPEKKRDSYEKIGVVVLMNFFAWIGVVLFAVFFLISALNPVFNFFGLTISGLLLAATTISLSD